MQSKKIGRAFQLLQTELDRGIGNNEDIQRCMETNPEPSRNSSSKFEKNRKLIKAVKAK